LRLFGRISIEDDANIDLDRTDEETLNYEVSDEALVAAGAYESGFHPLECDGQAVKPDGRQRWSAS
jgi:hypothetical protein